MTTMSRAGVAATAIAVSLAMLASVSLSGCVGGGPCGGGNPHGPNPPSCGAGEVAAENVDCSYCCMSPGQACLAANQGLTTTNPCCSGTCTDAGICACGAANSACGTHSDCCAGLSCAAARICVATDGG